MTDTLREKVAEALLSIEDSWNDHTWDQLPDNTKAMFLTQADAAIAAVMEALQTPTPKMIEAANKYRNQHWHEDNPTNAGIWQAMLCAVKENVK